MKKRVMHGCLLSKPHPFCAQSKAVILREKTVYDYVIKDDLIVHKQGGYLKVVSES